METSAINCLLKPIPIMFSQTFAYHNQFVTSAGSDINLDAQVYLLYEVPVTLLARRFINNKSDHIKIMVHELNGCIVGPGLYQEWTNCIYASRNRGEQNLELCRSQTNNMLYYRAIKPIKKGDPLLAWFSSMVESELAKSILGIDHFAEMSSAHCKFCSFDFHQPHMLKSHFLFDMCGKRLKLQKQSTPPPPPSSSSSCSSTSSFSFKNIHSTFSSVSEQKTEALSSRSSSSSPVSISHDSGKHDPA
ncbi:MDS1 and EVI1 complex locus EVI1-like, partial [Brachionus plicatilis]